MELSAHAVLYCSLQLCSPCRSSRRYRLNFQLQASITVQIRQPLPSPPAKLDLVQFSSL